MEKLKPFLKGPKIIFVILGVIILAEILLAVRYLRQVTPPPPPVVAPISSGKIALLADKKGYKVGDDVVVLARISTGGYSIIGTDLVLHYPPKALKATNASIKAGKIFSEFPMKEVDETSGTIRISGISSERVKRGFNGVGVFATITFKAITPGKASVTVDFQPGNTADSNIIDTKDSKDILSEVFSLELDIK